MDRNTFTGLFLILIILAGSFYLIKPSESDIKKEQARISVVDTLIKPAQKTAAAVKKVDSAQMKGPFGAAVQGENKTFTLENELLKVNIDAKGGKVVSVEVKNQSDFNGKPVMLLSSAQTSFGFDLPLGNTTFHTNDLYFTPVGSSNASQLTLRLSYSDTQYIEYQYSLPAKSYKLDFNANLNGMQSLINASALNLHWFTTLNQLEKDVANERRYSSLYYSQDGSVDFLNVNKDDTKELKDKAIEWISFKQHFFSSALIAKNGFESAQLNVVVPSSDKEVKTLSADLKLAFKKQAVESYPFQFYFGTNEFKTLNAQGHGLEKQVYLGYWPLKYINRYVVLPLFNFLDHFNLGYGIIILILTIVLKLGLSPLTYKSYLSMAKMRVLKPEIDAIKAKVGEDNQQLVQQETMKVYRKAGVNPLGGCLPMLLQMPIVLAFFFFFPNLFELRHQSFLWMSDLSTYDEFFKFGFKIPFLGSHISLMCLLMTISQLIFTWYNNQTSGATGQMKYIGYIMPVVFFGVLNNYPAGLNYYYFLANMLSFLQQVAIRKMLDDDKIHAMIQENKAKPESERKKSGFQARMEKMMQQAAEQQKNTKK